MYTCQNEGKNQRFVINFVIFYHPVVRNQFWNGMFEKKMHFELNELPPFIPIDYDDIDCLFGLLPFISDFPLYEFHK